MSKEKNDNSDLEHFFMIPGHHVAAWRHPDAKADDVLKFDFFIKKVSPNSGTWKV
ncbi:hypothetical protein GCM10020331_059340 [Ectobacillus funiculus]